MQELSATSNPKNGSSARRRILIVDDHPVFREGIAALLRGEKDLEICGEAESAPSALDAMRRLHPDITLLDISLPGPNGIELLKIMRAENPKMPVLMLSMHDESLYALRALKAGARGYVMKAEATGQIIDAIRKVLDGTVYVSTRFNEQLVFRAVQSLEGGLGSPVDSLSDRELEVFNFIGRGLGTRAIAEQLHLSAKTIETHRAHIKEKLGLRTATEMTRFAVDWVAHEEA